MDIIYVTLGGALGSFARYMIYKFALGSLWGTLAVNVLGSGMAIWLASILINQVSHQRLWITGFMGAFTTFSAFSVETIQLMQRGQLLHSFLYIGANVILSLAAAFFVYQSTHP